MNQRPPHPRSVKIAIPTSFSLTPFGRQELLCQRSYCYPLYDYRCFSPFQPSVKGNADRGHSCAQPPSPYLLCSSLMSLSVARPVPPLPASAFAGLPTHLVHQDHSKAGSVSRHTLPLDLGRSGCTTDSKVGCKSWGGDLDGQGEREESKGDEGGEHCAYEYQLSD